MRTTVIGCVYGVNVQHYQSSALSNVRECYGMDLMFGIFIASHVRMRERVACQS